MDFLVYRSGDMLHRLNCFILLEKSDMPMDIERELYKFMYISIYIWTSK